MRVLFGLLIASLLVAVAAGLITHKHVGALNHRLVKNKESSILSSQVSSLPEQWFTQVLDHFDGTNPSTWQQRYFVNDSFWSKPDGPVFIMLGGEGPISPAYVNGHFIVNDYAAEHGALIVAVEHRFYGKSIPGNNSQVSNLRFLSSQQALADIAVFHDHINSQYGVSNTAKWVSFGGSYSGSLSAWLRAKYPHLIYASFAASAPILAQLDFPQYFEVVSRSIGATCSNKIRNGYAQVLSLLESAEGKQKLQQLFNTCTPIVSENDVIQFLGAISNGFAGVVQYNDDNVGYEPFDITTLCQKLESIADDLQALAQMTLLYTADTTGPICMEVSYQQFLKDMTPTSDGRSWTYQTCTEFGYYQTGEASDQPFPPAISLASFLSQCADIFGIPGFTPHISFTNEYYGGKNIVTSNTVFTNGNVDPWHILGLTKRESGLQDKTAVIYMNGTAHCADLYPPRAADVPDLTRAREIQRSFLNAWLGGEDVAREVVMLS